MLHDYIPRLHFFISVLGVFGLPDPKVQELVTAVVVKKPDSDLKEEELIEFVNSRLPDNYKKIRGGLKFVEVIPRNPQGKVIKGELKAMFAKWTT